jgi:hypothetical protein
VRCHPLSLLISSVLTPLCPPHRRMLTKGSSARIHVQLRPLSSGATRRSVIPLEPFSINKSMGRVLFRRGGETIGGLVGACAQGNVADSLVLTAAGIVLEVLL